jgi:DNA-binding transcriptional ArsR family regulator
MPSTPTSRTTETELDQRLVRALAHPLRVRLLTLLNQQVASPNELAERVQQPLGKVAYHVRLLAKLDAIELVETKQRRGAVEHYYRALMRPWFREHDWTELPAPLRSSISAALLTQIWEETAESVQADTFDDRDDRHLSRTPLVLDDEGFKEIGRMLNQLLDRALEIQAESVERITETGRADDTPTSRLVMMHYTATAKPDKRQSRRKRSPKPAK